MAISVMFGGYEIQDALESMNAKTSREGIKKILALVDKDVVEEAAFDALTIQVAAIINDPKNGTLEWS